MVGSARSSRGEEVARQLGGRLSVAGSVVVGSYSGVVGHIEFEFGEQSCQWRFGDIPVGLRMVGVGGVDRGVEPSVGVIASAVAYSGDVEQLVDRRYEYDDG